MLLKHGSREADVKPPMGVAPLFYWLHCALITKTRFVYSLPVEFGECKPNHFLCLGDML